MRITIEPSDPTFTARTIIVDARGDEESTDTAVADVLNALVLYGHSQENVKEAANDYGNVPDLRTPD